VIVLYEGTKSSTKCTVCAVFSTAHLNTCAQESGVVLCNCDAAVVSGQTAASDIPMLQHCKGHVPYCVVVFCLGTRSDGGTICGVCERLINAQKCNFYVHTGNIE